MFIASTSCRRRGYCFSPRLKNPASSAFWDREMPPNWTKCAGRGPLPPATSERSALRRSRPILVKLIGGSLRDFEIILGLLFVAALVQPAARRLDVPLAIAQVVCGLVLSTLPFVARVELDPDVTFALFVPPLLFWASTTGSLRDVRRNARPILLLAVALVLVSTAAVAVVAHAVAPALPWASAFVLGAIVSPPDADVTTSIARRLGVPPRLVTILEGQTLLNDTAAFVTYRMAVQAAMVGAFSLGVAAGNFVLIAAGGVFV